MSFGIEVFKNDAPGGKATIVPIVVPVIAGPGKFTGVLSMRAEYNVQDIIVALFVKMIIVFLVLKILQPVQRIVGIGGVYVMRKFFGIILMAIAVKLFVSNIQSLF